MLPRLKMRFKQYDQLYKKNEIYLGYHDIRTNKRINAKQ